MRKVKVAFNARFNMGMCVRMERIVIAYMEMAWSAKRKSVTMVEQAVNPMENAVVSMAKRLLVGNASTTITLRVFVSD